MTSMMLPAPSAQHIRSSVTSHPLPMAAQLPHHKVCGQHIMPPSPRHATARPASFHAASPGMSSEGKEKDGLFGDDKIDTALLLKTAPKLRLPTVKHITEDSTLSFNLTQLLKKLLSYELCACMRVCVFVFLCMTQEVSDRGKKNLKWKK